VTQPLSPRQRVVLDFITDCITLRGYPPTLREICAHLGTTSTNGASDHIRALVRKGYLVHEDLKSRAIRLVGARCEHCGGLIPAGGPS
jgi:repressor LexA